MPMPRLIRGHFIECLTCTQASTAPSGRVTSLSPGRWNKTRCDAFFLGPVCFRNTHRSTWRPVFDIPFAIFRWEKLRKLRCSFLLVQIYTSRWSTESCLGPRKFRHYLGIPCISFCFSSGFWVWRGRCFPRLRYAHGYIVPNLTVEVQLAFTYQQKCADISCKAASKHGSRSLDLCDLIWRLPANPLAKAARRGGGGRR